jgi:hypothetical protein
MLRQMRQMPGKRDIVLLPRQGSSAYTSLRRQRRTPPTSLKRQRRGLSLALQACVDLSCWRPDGALGPSARTGEAARNGQGAIVICRQGFSKQALAAVDYLVVPTLDPLCQLGLLAESPPTPSAGLRWHKAARLWQNKRCIRGVVPRPALTGGRLGDVRPGLSPWLDHHPPRSLATRREKTRRQAGQSPFGSRRGTRAPLARRGRSAAPPGQSLPQCGQGCGSPQSWPWCVVTASNPPALKPGAAAEATSSLGAKSSACPVPCVARRLSVGNSWGAFFRVALAWPSWTLEQSGKANSV